MKKSYHWFIVMAATLALTVGAAEDGTFDTADLVKLYIEGQGHLPRNRDLSRKLDEVADEIAPMLRVELERQQDGDSLIAIARLATRIPDKSEAKVLVSAVREKINKIEGYSSDPLVAQNLQELERLVEDAALMDTEANKSNSSGAGSDSDPVIQRERLGQNGASKREQKSSDADPWSDDASKWPYMLVVVSVVGVVFVMVRAGKNRGKKGRS
jgi:hypothetical protein